MAPHDERTCWLVKAGSGGGRARALVGAGVVAVGEEWPGVGDLGAADDASVFLALEAGGRRKPADDLVQIRIFSSRMSTGDVVVTPDGRDVLFGTVTGEYAYAPGGQTGEDIHQRPVEWFGRLAVDRLEPFLAKAVAWRAGRLRRLPEQVHWLRVAGEVRDGLGRPADDFPRTPTAKVARGGAGARTPRRAAAPAKAQPTGVPQKLCPSCGLLRANSLFDDDEEYCRDCA